MTEQSRLKAAKRLRRLLDGGVLRKVALAQVRLEFRCGRSTLYGWCSKFGISTK